MPTREDAYSYHSSLSLQSNLFTAASLRAEGRGRYLRFNCIFILLYLIICPTTPQKGNDHHEEAVFTCFFLFFFSFVSDIIEPDFFRKVKDKRPSAGSTAGQILPVISDKSSHVTQVQGSRQDQIGKRRTLIFCRRGGGVGGWAISEKGGQKYHLLLLVVEVSPLNVRVRVPL